MYYRASRSILQECMQRIGVSMERLSRICHIYLYRENKVYTGRAQLICIIHNLWFGIESAGCARITKGQEMGYSRIRTLGLLSGFVNVTGFDTESALNHGWSFCGHSVYENVCPLLYPKSK